jgi:hypothetical protein
MAKMYDSLQTLKISNCSLPIVTKMSYSARKWTSEQNTAGKVETSQ